jgi:hypothetical protein
LALLLLAQHINNKELNLIEIGLNYYGSTAICWALAAFSVS